MKDTDLFQMALGLTPPWQVQACEFDPDKKQLDIMLDFPKGSTFDCPECGLAGCKAYDTADKRWKHLNFFQHETYLHARVPRVDCKECGVKTIEVPWARPGSGFTLLFEAFIMAMGKEMTPNAVGRIINEHDTRIWRVLKHYVHEARTDEDYTNVTSIGIDETASKRGHNYVSVVMDLIRRKVIFATENRDHSVLRAFAKDLQEHGGNPENIKTACCDMSPAYIKGVTENFETAQLVFDRFHIMKLLNEAVDQVRREEQHYNKDLKKTRYLWLKNSKNLSEKQRDKFRGIKLLNFNSKTVRAWQIKLSFQEFYDQPLATAEQYLKKWYFWATHSRLEPIKQAAYTIKRHLDGVLAWHQHKISNGILEGTNSLIQAAKAKARGYRTTENLITMIYMIAGKLNFKLPT